MTQTTLRTEDEHFVVSCPKGKDEVLVPYLLDALEGQRRGARGAWARCRPAGSTVEIVGDTRELSRALHPQRGGDADLGHRGGGKFGKLMMLSPKALLKGYDWLDTAAHEFTHNVVTDRTHNGRPSGCTRASPSGSSSAGAGGDETGHPVPRRWCAGAARRTLVTFEEMHPSFAKLPTQEPAALAYAEVACSSSGW